ncbi:MAG: signal transduction histidine kinase [Myxococcota bacterium]
MSVLTWASVRQSRTVEPTGTARAPSDYNVWLRVGRFGPFASTSVLRSRGGGTINNQVPVALSDRHSVVWVCGARDADPALRKALWPRPVRWATDLMTAVEWALAHQASALITQAESGPEASGPLCLLAKTAPDVAVFTTSNLETTGVLATRIATVLAHVHETAQARRHAAELVARERALGHWEQELAQWTEELLHEVRTPASIAVGHGANLQDGILGPLSDQQAESLNHVMTAARHLAGVVESAQRTRPVSPFVMRTDRPGARRSRVSPVALCREVLALLGGAAAGKGISLVAIGDESGEIWAEPGRLTQALLNLLSNALRYTPAGGRITLEVTRDADPNGRSGGECVIRVSDTGPGLPQALAGRVFERGVTGEVKGHAGIGLSVCADVAREHGGSLGHVDTGGSGASFTLRLPADARTRSPEVRVRSIRDPALAEMLLTELRGRQQLGVVIEPAENIEQLARELASTGGQVVVLQDGALDALEDASALKQEF